MTTEVQEGPDATVAADATETETETAAAPSVNENNDEPKKETHDERQTRLKAEARAFALSGGSCLRGPATYNQHQQKNSTKKQKRKTPVKRRAKAAAKASYSSESSNSSISDFSDDNDDDDAFFGSSKKRKATQESGAFLVPTMYQMPTTYMTVRVQVPYEELLPGRKMVVDLPGRLPLEVVVPTNIAPGTIIPVQVPLGEGMMDPYSSQQYTSLKQQKQQQKKQKRQNKVEVPLTCRDQNWMNVFKRLVAYQKEHHTTRVPRTYNKDSRLGRWVFQQREEKKNMTEDKRLLLNSIDFDWDVPTRAPTMPWTVMYQQLAEYYGKNSTTMLTKKNGSDNRLFSWCSGQRERYRKKNMPDDQVKLLNDLHFDFEHSLNNTWMEKYKLMIKYKEDNGTTRAPKSHPELGQWVANQRQRKPSLKKERIELLDKIDFDWTKGHTPDTVWNGFVKGKDEASV
jgi:hypothetical protein